MAVASSLFSLLAVVPETTFGTPVDPSSGSFYHVGDGQQVNNSRDNMPIPDKTGDTRSEQGSIPGAPMTDASLPFVVRASGTAGTVPVVDPILENTHFLADIANTADAVQVSPSPTTTAYAIATPSNVTARTFVVVKSANFSSPNSPEMRWCSANAAGTLTVTPPHSAAPAAADVVSATNTYRLRSARDESLSIWRYLNDSGGDAFASEVVAGWAPSDCEITWENDNGYLTMTWSGDGSGKYIYTGQTTLGAAITGTGDTSITLADLGQVAVGSRILIDSECLTVTAKSAETGSGTATVLRGQNSTTAATHSNSAPVKFYRPSYTLSSQAPIPAIYCDVFFGPVATKIPATRLSIRLSDNIQMLRSAAGDQGEATGYVPGKRTVEVSIDAWLDTTTLKALFRGQQAAGLAMFIQLGNTVGKLVGVYMPNVVLNGIPVPTDGDQAISVTFAGQARLSAVAEDELALGFG